jgi:hypothetical protein
MKEPSKQTVRALRKEDEQIEVSFTTLTIDKPVAELDETE